MRKIIVLSVLTPFCSMGVIDSSVAEQPSNKLQAQIAGEIERENKIKQNQKEELERLLKEVGFRESSNRYNITKKWG